MIKSSHRLMAGLVLALCSLSAAALLGPVAPALAGTCPNEEFRTGAGANLPDCRAYELVTPPFKEASQVSLRPTGSSLGDEVTGVSVDGSHVDVASFGDFGDAQSGLFYNSYELTRTESGWTETSIDLPASQFPESVPIERTPELGAVLYEARATEQSLRAKDLWLREADGVLRDIGPFEPPQDTEGPPGFETIEVESIEQVGGSFAAASADLSHILFYSPVSWPGDEAYGSLYEYVVGRGGPPIPVGVEPGGSPCAAGADGISADGSTVVFECSGKLFARIDNSEAGARTVAISTGAANFVAASPDGSDVFYTEAGALYRFDVTSATGEVVEPVSAGVSSVVGINETGEDGAYVYLDATGAMTGANAEGNTPKEGEQNLYVLERDAQFPGGRLTFIATVSPGTPSLTPDGRFLVFTSYADLTPGDTSTAQQVFEYDAQTESLVRVSIGQNGFNDNGNTDTFGAELPEQFYYHRPQTPPVVSDNGAYVAFQSADGLTPRALNGVEEPGSNGEIVPANNVYEYHDGNVYLISDGLDTSSTQLYGSAVELEGMSSSGENIFFTTADQLVPQDQDSEVDLYDARIDGGFPPPVSLLPSCSGDGCQGELSAAPTLLSPGSEFQAGGNPPLTDTEPPSAKPKAKSKPEECKKGHMRQKGKCVKKPRARKTKAKNTRAGNSRRGGS